MSIQFSKKIYIMCPATVKTGGPELLHQLGHELDLLNKDVYMLYVGKNNSASPVNNSFEIYNVKYCWFNEIEDIKDNAVIIPETYIHLSNKFKNVKKLIWWLSVDFYTSRTNIGISLKTRGLMKTLLSSYMFLRNTDKLIKTADLQLCQSNYAIEYLQNLNIENDKILYLSDYINDVYFEEESINENRKNQVLYNPKKGIKFTNKLIKKSENLNWIPIKNMTNKQVVNLMRESKVYIDFGNHPGKDRIPREAAMCGCCIITNKCGSAQNNEDVKILNQYKYDQNKNNIDQILMKINECLENYASEIKNYEVYKKIIRGEKNKFREDVRKIFG